MSSITEVIIVLVLISIFVGVLYSKYQTIETVSKQNVRNEEVRILNLATLLYKVRNGHFPDSIISVIDEGYIDNSSLEFFQTRNRVMERVFVDPFGNPYRYDNTTGVVR